MTKKDYIRIADALRYNVDQHFLNSTIEFVEGYTEAVNAVCRALRDDNPNFDEARFLEWVLK